MKKGKVLCASTFLSLVLSVPVFAGDIQIPTLAAPPTPLPEAGEPDKTGRVSGPSAPAGDSSIMLMNDLLYSMFSLY
jgi:hypothetical protein